MVAVERLAGYMATIDAAMEILKEKKLAAKQALASRQMATDQWTEHPHDEVEQREEGENETTGSGDEMERAQASSTGFKVDIDEPKDNKALSKRPKKNKPDLGNMVLHKIPSVVEFTIYSDQNDEKSKEATLVHKLNEVFCHDMMYCQPSLSPYDHAQWQRLENFMEDD
jgi:hypothetical protein